MQNQRQNPPLVVFLPGLFNSVDFQGRLFEAQRKAAIEYGLRFELVALQPVGSFEENARHITHFLNERPGPFLMISHSKGGLDFEYALLKNPLLIPKVQAWISMNTPFAGSPLAQLHHKNRLFKSLAPSALNFIFQQESTLAIDQLRPEERGDFVERHFFELQELYSQVRHFNIRTQIDEEWIRRLFRLFHIDEALHQSDGVVPIESQKSLFATEYDVLLPNLWHNHTAYGHFKSAEFCKAQFTKTVFDLILQPRGSDDF